MFLKYSLRWVEAYTAIPFISNANTQLHVSWTAPDKPNYRNNHAQVFVFISKCRIFLMNTKVQIKGSAALWYHYRLIIIVFRMQIRLAAIATFSCSVADKTRLQSEAAELRAPSNNVDPAMFLLLSMHLCIRGKVNYSSNRNYLFFFMILFSYACEHIYIAKSGIYFSQHGTKHNQKTG